MAGGARPDHPSEAHKTLLALTCAHGPPSSHGAGKHPYDRHESHRIRSSSPAGRSSAVVHRTAACLSSYKASTATPLPRLHGLARFQVGSWEGHFATLTAEFAPFGIKTVHIEPGVMRMSSYDAGAGSAERAIPWRSFGRSPAKRWGIWATASPASHTPPSRRCVRRPSLPVLNSDLRSWSAHSPLSRRLAMRGMKSRSLPAPRFTHIVRPCQN